MDSAKADLLWKMYQDNAAQSKHHETERKNITGVVITLAAALVGLVTFDRAVSGGADAALAGFIIVLGLFGAGFSYKNYERSCYHFARARKFRTLLDEGFADGLIAQAQAEADSEHDQNFRRIRKVRLHRWWLALNLIVTLIGGSLLVLSLYFPFGMGL